MKTNLNNHASNGQVRKKQKQCVKQNSCNLIICDLEQRISKSLEQQKLINKALVYEIEMLSNHVSQFQPDNNPQINGRNLINNQQQLNNNVKFKRMEQDQAKRVNITKLIRSVQIEASVSQECHQAIDHSVGNSIPDQSCIGPIYSHEQILGSGSVDHKDEVNLSNKSTHINSKIHNVTNNNIVCSGNSNYQKQGDRKLKDQILSRGLPSCVKSSNIVNYINISNIKIGKSINNEIKSNNKNINSNKIPFRLKHKS